MLQKKLRLYILIVILTISSTIAYAQTIQIRRQGFIYDQNNKKVDLAFLEMSVYYKNKKNKIIEKIYQTQSNDMGLYFFNVFLEIDQNQLLAVRIEWKNYKKQLGEKHDQYAPGYNPYWEFTKEYLDRPGALQKIPLTFIRDIHLESKENPIPVNEAKALAKKFAPILIFDEDKKQMPGNIEKFYNNHKIETYKVKTKDKEGVPPYQGRYMRFPDLSKYKKLAMKKEAHLYVHIRPLPTYYTGRQTGRLEDFKPNIYWYESKKITGYVISYFFWYDRAEGPSYLGNSYQGDWQGYAIYLDKDKKPQRILTIGHHHILVDTSWNNINSINNHPILFVASGFWSDGSNVTLPNIPVKGKKFKDRKSIPVKLDKRVVDWFGFSRDKFPNVGDLDIKLLIPNKKIWPRYGLEAKHFSKVIFGSQEHTIDLSKKIKANWKKIVLWQEPGLVKIKKIAPEYAFFMNFNGRTGRHPFRFLKFFLLQYIGQSSMNVPFEMNANNIFIREYPRKDRSYKANEKNHYGPYWRGNDKTPQFIP